MVAISVISVFIFIASNFDNAEAASPLSASLRVYPVKVEMPFTAGKESTATIYVENMANLPVNMQVYAQDFTLDKNGKYKFINQKLPESISMASWISFAEPKFMLQAHETKKIAVKLMAPKHIEPGGHYAIVFFEARPKIANKNRLEEAYMIMNTRVGALILGSSGGKVKHAEKLKSLSIPNYNYDSKIPVNIIFENKGNIHASLNGFIIFTNSAGKMLGKISIKNRTSFPSVDLNITKQWGSTVEFGRIKATVQLESLDGRKWNKSKTFLIIPLKQIMIGLAVVAVLAVVFFIGRKKLSFSFTIVKRQEKPIETPEGISEDTDNVLDDNVDKP
jgi:hypothetical protein